MPIQCCQKSSFNISTSISIYWGITSFWGLYPPDLCFNNPPQYSDPSRDPLQHVHK